MHASIKDDMRCQRLFAVQRHRQAVVAGTGHGDSSAVGISLKQCFLLGGCGYALGRIDCRICRIRGEGCGDERERGQRRFCEEATSVRKRPPLKTTSYDFIHVRFLCCGKTFILPFHPKYYQTSFPLATDLPTGIYQFVGEWGKVGRRRGFRRSAPCGRFAARASPSGNLTPSAQANPATEHGKVTGKELDLHSLCCVAERRNPLQRQFL